MYYKIIDNKVKIYSHTEPFYFTFLPEINENTDLCFDKFFALIKTFDFENAIIECDNLENNYPGIAYYNNGTVNFIIKNYDLAEKYYLMAIELGNSDAMREISQYYYHIAKNNTLAKKYCLMAIKLGNSDAMCDYGHYNEEIIKNYKLAEKYYLMAIKLGNSDAMCDLGLYYVSNMERYDLAEEYYLAAVELSNSNAMYYLGCYHMNITKKYDLAEKYLLMAIALRDCDAMCELGNYHINITKNYNLANEYFLMASALNHCDAMECLANYHDCITKDKNLVEKYLLMAVEIDKTFYHKLITFNLDNKNYKNALKYLNEWSVIINSKSVTNEECVKSIAMHYKSEFINAYIQNLIDQYKHQIIRNEECLICLEENNIIQLECRHYVCNECITKVTKCVYCEKKFFDFIIHNN